MKPLNDTGVNLFRIFFRFREVIRKIKIWHDRLTLTKVWKIKNYVVLSKKYNSIVCNLFMVSFMHFYIIPFCTDGSLHRNIFTYNYWGRCEVILLRRPNSRRKRKNFMRALFHGFLQPNPFQVNLGRMDFVIHISLLAHGFLRTRVGFGFYSRSFGWCCFECSFSGGLHEWIN